MEKLIKKSEIKIINELAVYENNYGTLYDDEVLFLPQKISGNYVRWKWKSPYSIGVLPVMPNFEFTLIENYRHAARKSIIEVPKGYGEDDIEPLEMAKKELEDETGFVSDNWEYLGEVLADTSFTYHPMKLFIAWNCNSTGLTNHEESEVIISKHTYSLSMVPKLVSDLTIYDAITLFLLMSAYQRR